MRHLKKGRKLNRTSSHRKAMLSNMASSLVFYKRIKTTLPKAKTLGLMEDFQSAKCEAASSMCKHSFESQGRRTISTEHIYALRHSTLLSSISI